METPDQYSKEDLEKILEALGDDDRYGMVLRAKGMVCLSYTSMSRKTMRRVPILCGHPR